MVFLLSLLSVCKKSVKAMVKTIRFNVGYVQNGAVGDNGLEHNNLTHHHCFKSIQGHFLFGCIVFCFLFFESHQTLD